MAAQKVRCPEFLPGFTWLNARRPLTVAQDMRGRSLSLIQTTTGSYEVTRKPGSSMKLSSTERELPLPQDSKWPVISEQFAGGS